MVKTWILLVICILLSINTLFAQNVISAQVVDSIGQGIPNVTITYKEKNGAAVAGFTRSGPDGSFKLSVQTSASSFLLMASHLGYGKIDTLLNNRTANYIFKLSARPQRLNEVKVKSSPIYKSKDTLNFLADAFASKQDRAIADIIKKLPGVEMDGDRIFYQGKPIQKYMVNNLDLMEGRYGLINNNLPAIAVKKIQIIENDQPIKLLDSLVVSNRASLNIELKKFTTTGTGKIGIGYEPALWDVNLTPMTFNRNFQSINSFQSNNTGNDVTKQLDSHNIMSDGIIDGAAAVITPGESFLELQNVAVPGFEENKWLDNRVFLFSSNMLMKLKNEMQVKANVSYFNDLQNREGAALTQVFTPGQEVLIAEDITNRYSRSNLRLGLVLEKNEKKIFFKNDLQFHRRWNDDNGRLLFNGTDQIQQDKIYRDLGLTNKLSVARFVAKQLVSFNSTFTYGETPQQLIIEPGQFAAILNNGNPYSQLHQQVLLNRFNTANSFSFSKKAGAFLITPRLGVDYKRDHLRSGIGIEAGGKNVLGEGFVNDQYTSHFKTYLDASLQYKRKQLNITFQSPYTLNVFNTQQLGKSVLNNEKRMTLNPRLTARITLNENNELTLGSGYNSQFGDLTSLYNAFIVSTYRDIQRYNSQVRQTNSLNSSVYYKYANVVEGTFARMSYRYEQSRKDFIIRNTIDSSGLREISLEDRESSSLSHDIAGNAGKLFSGINTIIKINASLTSGESDYLLNNQFGKLKNVSYGAGLDITNNSYQFMTLHYKGSWGTSESKLADESRYKSTTTRQDFNISLYPFKNHSVNWSNSYYITNVAGQPNQMFIDLMYRWALENPKVDFEFSCINLLNKRQYIQRLNADYAVVESYFNLRPRQFAASVRFRF